VFCCHSIQTHHPDSESTSLWTLCCRLCREAANTNYTCSLRFDQTGDITSDLWSPIALKAIMFPHYTKAIHVF